MNDKHQIKSKFQIISDSVILCLIALALLSTLLSGKMYARYVSGERMAENAEVAAFAFDVDSGDGRFSIDISEVNYPGAEKVYTFTLTNGKNRISEVATAISAEISLGGELPLNIVLSEGEKNFIELNSAETRGASITDFKAGEPESKTLTLTVKWPKEMNSAEYSGKTARLSVSFTAEQIN